MSKTNLQVEGTAAQLGVEAIINGEWTLEQEHAARRIVAGYCDRHCLLGPSFRNIRSKLLRKVRRLGLSHPDTKKLETA